MEKKKLSHFSHSALQFQAEKCNNSGKIFFLGKIYQHFSRYLILKFFSFQRNKILSYRCFFSNLAEEEIEKSWIHLIIIFSQTYEIQGFSNSIFPTILALCLGEFLSHRCQCPQLKQYSNRQTNLGFCNLNLTGDCIMMSK